LAAMNLEGLVRDVLAHYPGISPTESLIYLGNRGGFSGARLWRVHEDKYCLKAWPANGKSSEHLAGIHEWMRTARASGLAFVPDVLPTRAGQTCIEYVGRLWDLTTWMPGAADYHEHPSSALLRSACVALARLHFVWSRQATAGSCPAVLRRMRTAVQWEELRRQGWRPTFVKGSVDPVQPSAQRAWDLVLRHMEGLTSLLLPFAKIGVPLHPCLCDVWHDHVLFHDQDVSGIIDYGSAKTDHPAVDLARLLGSLDGDDPGAWAQGLQSYREVRPFEEWEEHLATVLDRTGLVLAAANWLRWLYFDNRSYEDRQAVANRLSEIVERLERRRD
jgi:Ser/Thr protein kinase RdoA (MazF antagonist)